MAVLRNFTGSSSARSVVALKINNYKNMVLLCVLITLCILPHQIFNGVNAQAAASIARQQFLQLHNGERARHGLPALTWDARLEAYAASYAAKARCQMVHSGGPYGENLLWGSSGKQWTAGDAMNTWLSEAKEYNPATNTCNGGPANCGHYTQIVWKSTTSVGCAIGVCPGGSTLVVCEYNPPGNVVGRRPF